MLLSVVAWRIGATAQSPEQAAAAASEPTPSWITAPVERRVLSATVVQRGDVRAQSSTSIIVPSSVEGDPVVTQIVVSAGAEVADGSRVIEISGRPVFVLEGSVPVYRTLRPGMNGDDVQQLQDALTRFGFAADSNGVFGELTKQGIADFYAQAGYDPVPASPNAAVDIAAASQALDDAEAAVTAAQLALDDASEGQPASAIAQAEAALNDARRTLDSAVIAQQTDVTLAQQQLDAAVAELDRLVADPETRPADSEAAAIAVEQARVNVDSVARSAQNAVDTARESVRVASLSLDEVRRGGETAQAQAVLDAAIAARDRAQGALMIVVAANGPTVPQGEMVFVPATPARVLSASTALGPVGAAGQSDSAEAASSGGLVELASGGLVVSTQVRPGDFGLVRVGMDVELLDESAGVTYPASIAELGNDSVTGPDGQLGHPAVITPDALLPDSLTGANVRVTITSASTEGPALIVPLAAVSSSADGTTRVSVVDGPNGAPVDVEVEAGMSADGFVVIEPVVAGAVDAGDLVVVGR